MKKTLSILMLLVYTILTIGMSVNIHTCGEESEALLVTTSAQDPCIAGSEMPMGDPSDMGLAGMCCSTEIKTVKLDDAQKGTISVQPNSLVIIEYLPSASHLLIDIQHSLFVIPTDTSPPPNKDYQTSNSVFLI
jgi:hypothetical protein